VGDENGNKKRHELQIVRDPKICGGQPVFKGTRVTLRTVLVAFPSLKPKHTQAAIAFAAASAEEDLSVPEIPRIR
jgi:uncharacterized protein (DUF433 family)